MAFEMPYTDDFGEVYPSSYWKVARCTLDRMQHVGVIIFNGYASAATLGKRIIATKTYRVDSDLYETFFKTSVLDPQNSNPYCSSYLMAVQVKDVSVEEGKLYISFFEDAKQV